MGNEENNLLLSETRVEKVLNKGKEAYVLLMVKSNWHDFESTLHPEIKAIISKLQDIFPKDVSSLRHLI